MHKDSAISPPRVVTTGGNYSPQVAHIDWLGFTVQLSETRNMVWLINELRQFFPNITLKPTGKGWFGYDVRHDIQHLNDNVNLGLIAHGGDSQRGTASIQLNAQGCSLIQDWQSLQLWGSQNAKKITRIDLAHDDFEGTTLSIANALEWHQQGMFSHNGSRQGQTAVKATLIDDLASGDGKTFYVGRRGSGKLLRIYEKGRQLGDKLSNWVRAEVELKDKDRVIPWDALINPSHYLAAAYPCLAYLSETQVKIKTIKKAVSTSIDAAVHHLRQMGGMLINVMLMQHHGDALEVVSRLKRDGVPKRLVNYASHLPMVFSEVAS